MKLEKNIPLRLPLQILLLLVAAIGAAFLFLKQLYLPAIFVLAVMLWITIALYKIVSKAQEEVQDFANSIYYRDFTRHFDEKNVPAEWQPMHSGFNKINQTFKLVSREKETQFLYLQKILELVDTGILSYNMQTGEIVWMNESLKKMLQVPYLKSIDSMEKRLPTLYAACKEIRPGSSHLINVNTRNESFKLLLAATAFQTDGETYKLIAFQNVHSAMDETEANAWQKLLSVMTHEIMNSVAPISSLADTLKRRLQESRDEKMEDSGNALEDLEVGIETIKRRSEGLLKFAAVYRNLNKIQQANLQQVKVLDQFENLLQLFQPNLEQKGIELETVLKEPGLEIEMDGTLIEQVLINLLLNAMDALKEKTNPRIILSAYQNNGRKFIEMSDNGIGIAPELIDQIFVPFFSTKKSGSGIGLSLCRQIMLLHKGSIQVFSKENEGSRFVLKF
jgi:two-component system, NtrC family, nitrogen regulation sensor histidine kinase NtrY